jgi:hypothetical protein
VQRRAFLCLAALPLAGQSRPDPQALYDKVLRNPNLNKNGRGEDFCWNAAYDLHRFVSSYQTSGDRAWLDWGVRYYEYLLDQMQAGPDGYLGWIGPYEYDNRVWCDVHVGDAILFDGLVEFARIALADAALRKQYGAQAERYVALARRHLFEKWDARGTWETDGPYGAYRSWNRYGEPGNLNDWPVREEIRNSGLALPFNKQDDLGAVALKLYRITGEQAFRDRATRIFAFQKSRLQLVNDSYVWNYWEPFGPEDVDLPAGNTRHWVGVHPDRPYQQGEVAHIVEAYHTGVVFDETDLRRILKTNLETMWNGSFETPAFRNSNAGLPGANPKNTAGALWPALGDFDETVRRLAKQQRRDPASFDRKHLRGRATVFEFPFAACTPLNMAAALPACFPAAEGTLLASNALLEGTIEIAQYSADGKTKLAPIHEETRNGKLFHRWTGMKPGDYRVRWTFNAREYREQPVTVVG